MKPSRQPMISSPKPRPSHVRARQGPLGSFCDSGRGGGHGRQDPAQAMARCAAGGGRMRFLAVTETCDLSALYLRLQADGHEVKVSVSWEEAQGTLANMVPRTEDWRAELDWIRQAP